MSEPLQRRRFRFSLRSFFIVLTAFALWLGWNAYQVRQRNRVEQYIVRLAAHNPPIVFGEPLKPWKSLPITWQLMGVKPIQFAYLGRSTVEEDRKYLRKWLPEAELVYFGD